MKSAGRILALILILFTALVATAGADHNPRNSGSPIHLISCTIEKVNQCLAQEATSGYAAIHIAATIMDRPRNNSSPGYGIFRSEDPVLVTRKSNVLKRQTVAIIDDLAKREQQLNQAGAAGMRLLPNEVAVLRSWGGGVSVEGYAALFEEVTPAARFEYRVVDVADKAVAEKLKELLFEGYRSVAFVAPAIIVMERGAENVSKIDEYRVLQGFDAQHVGSELTKAATPGFRVVTAGVSSSGLLTTALLEHVAGDKQNIEYQVFSGYNARELERKLNETAQQGYSPVPGGILPIATSRTDFRGMTPPPQRVELIIGKPAAQKYSAFKVLNAFGKDLQSKLDTALRDGYEFVEFVGVTNDNFVILGHPAQPSAAGQRQEFGGVGGHEENRRTR
jgi:hypothetical protein